jgi:hypothetical protein
VVLIARSARRHDISDEAVHHALRLPISFERRDDGVTLLIGADWGGNLIEVGYVETDGDDLVVVHAMPARASFVR